MGKEFTAEIVEHGKKLSQGRGWATEINKVSYNGREAKWDIRPWNEDHSKMGKGITLTDEEMLVLRDFLNTK